MKKGFIQIPILIAIIASILVIGGGSYFGTKQYQKIQSDKAEKANQTQKLTEAQLEALKKEVADLKNNTATSTSENNQSEKPEPSQAEVTPQSSIKVQATQSAAPYAAPTSVSSPVAAPASTPTPRTEENKNSIITLPSGAIVEVDTKGNLIRIIKASPLIVSQPATLSPTPSPIPFPSPTPTQAPVEKPKVTVSLGLTDYRYNLQYKKPGSKDYLFSSIKMTSDKKAFLNSIKWNQTGSGVFSELHNFKTYIDGMAFDIVVSIDGKYGTSNFNGVIINPGETKTVSVKGDLPEIICSSMNGCATSNGAECEVNELCSGCIEDGNGRSCSYPYHTFRFDIYREADLGIKDENENTIIAKPEIIYTYNDHNASGYFSHSNPWFRGYLVEMEPAPLLP